MKYKDVDPDLLRADITRIVNPLFLCKSPKWLRAFATYNEENVNNQLSVLCGICYTKVYLYFKNKLDEIPQQTI